MVPDFALRIHAMIRSLREVVLPTLPNDEMLAIDQANILVGYLRIMALQHDKVFDYLLAELSEYAALVSAMAEDAPDGQDEVVATARAALAEAAPILKMSIPRESELAGMVRLALGDIHAGLLESQPIPLADTSTGVPTRQQPAGVEALASGS